MKIAIIYKTHIWNDEIASTFEYMRQSLPNHDVFLSYNTKTCTPSLTYDKIHKYGNFLFDERKWSQLPTGENYNEDNLMWYRSDVSIVDFSVLHPEYDFVWNIDYDVTYDHWNDFIETTTPHLTNVDFLSSDIECLTEPTPHGYEWWSRQSTNKYPLAICYFPFVGISKRAGIMLNEQYKIHNGYCEVIMPSLILQNNMNCKDIKDVYPNYKQFKHKDLTPFGRYTDYVWHLAHRSTSEQIDQMKNWIVNNIPNTSLETLNTIHKSYVVKEIYFNYPGGTTQWDIDHSTKSLDLLF
jgi:hypothetical protein